MRHGGFEALDTQSLRIRSTMEKTTLTWQACIDFSSIKSCSGHEPSSCSTSYPSRHIEFCRAPGKKGGQCSVVQMLQQLPSGDEGHNRMQPSLRALESRRTTHECCASNGRLRHAREISVLSPSVPGMSLSELRGERCER